jgi:hypothetical protein
MNRVQDFLRKARNAWNVGTRSGVAVHIRINRNEERTFCGLTDRLRPTGRGSTCAHCRKAAQEAGHVLD